MSHQAKNRSMPHTSEMVNLTGMESNIDLLSVSNNHGAHNIYYDNLPTRETAVEMVKEAGNILAELKAK